MAFSSGVLENTVGNVVKSLGLQALAHGTGKICKGLSFTPEREILNSISVSGVCSKRKCRIPLTDFYCKVAVLQKLQLKIKKRCDFCFGLNVRCSSIFFYKYTASVDQSKVKMSSQ